MAYEANITKDEHFFYGEDKRLEFTVYKADNVTPQDVAGWSLVWTVRSKDSSTTITMEKTTAAGQITVTGTYDVDPLVNTQRVNVVLSDDDTLTLKGGKTYRHSLKRLDAANETILSFGNLVVSIATSW